MKKLYKILEINETANEKEIKKAYRKLAKKYHPDMNKEKEAEDKFKEINAAYEILGDKKKKEEYDMYGDRMFEDGTYQNRNQNTNQYYGGFGGMDINDILNQMFGDRNKRQGFNQDFYEEDLDIEGNITIDFRKAILGGKLKINIKNRLIEINIPKGIKNGQKIRNKNKGESSHGKTGDLILTINIKDDYEYERNEDDLIKTIDISLYKSLFGGKVEVSTLYGNVIVNIPKGIKNGQKLRIKEKGVYNRKTKKYGNLNIKINIVNPKIDDLSEKLKKILKDELPQEIR